MEAEEIREEVGKCDDEIEEIQKKVGDLGTALRVVTERKKQLCAELGEDMQGKLPLSEEGS